MRRQGGEVGLDGGLCRRTEAVGAVGVSKVVDDARDEVAAGDVVGNGGYTVISIRPMPLSGGGFRSRKR
mgnify:CR=1 FL=1